MWINRVLFANRQRTRFYFRQSCGVALIEWVINLIKFYVLPRINFRRLKDFADAKFPHV